MEVIGCGSFHASAGLKYGHGGVEFVESPAGNVNLATRSSCLVCMFCFDEKNSPSDQFCPIHSFLAILIHDHDPRQSY